MIFGSVCSGIEAASCAWYPLGWEAAFVSEIEPFPCSVLKQHYPEVPNYGDMTKFQEWPDARINVLVGGTPCQSFSVAGLRKGLADPRGNLMLTYLAIADQYRPEWVVWENVPGVLSSNGGRDFASFLRGLAELGYGFAYRILDAQYFGVAQRRRRVFVVGHIGDWRRAAAVLFERHSLQGHPAPRREAGKEAAGTFTARAKSGGWGQDPNLAAGGYMQPVGWPAEIAPALDTTMKKYMGLDNQHINGGGGGLLPEVANPLTARMHKGINTTCDEGQTMIPTIGGGFDDDPIAFGWQNSAQQGASASASHTPTLDKSKVPAISYPIDTQNMTENHSSGGKGFGEAEDPSFTITKGHSHGVATAMQVRRLTPRECERLQGFPDDYTLVQHRNKPAADGPRYKALGNSMAVPVMAWIGRRIAMVDQLKGASFL